MNVQKIWFSLVSSKHPAVRFFVRYARHLIGKSHKFTALLSIPLFYLFRIFPLQNKAVMTSFRGRKYGDNPQVILEALKEISPDMKFVWLYNPRYRYSCPSYVKKVSFFAYFKNAYEISTAKVFVNSHRMEHHLRKRKGQLIIETWHGGLGLKKIEGDVSRVLETPWEARELNNTAKISDLFISNSDHLSQIYRRAFFYRGKIWKCGYPKNDILFSEAKPFRKKVFDALGISSHLKVLVYAPTFRDDFSPHGFNREAYDIDFEKLRKALETKFLGEWKILVRFHPVMSNYMGDISKIYGDSILDATKYPDMQELILSSDAFLSDYSSCIFDAALREIPCFMFATDFENYKAYRGVYYELEELPFPCAKNNEELKRNVLEFDEESYLSKWGAFKERTGLLETGHAAKDIARVISEFVRGNEKILEEIKNEP